MKLLAFGDIFSYGDEPYVYLASNGHVTYCAKIVRQKTASYLIATVEHIMRQGSTVQQAAAQDNLSYRFVVLKTEGYIGDIAKLDRTDEQRDEARFSFSDEKLCDTDLKMLKKEILDSPVPRGLKKQINEIEI